jgi:hypothetical protein
MPININAGPRDNQSFFCIDPVSISKKFFVICILKDNGNARAEKGDAIKKLRSVGRNGQGGGWCL